MSAATATFVTMSCESWCVERRHRFAYSRADGPGRFGTAGARAGGGRTSGRAATYRVSSGRSSEGSAAVYGRRRSAGPRSVGSTAVTVR